MASSGLMVCLVQSIHVMDILLITSYPVLFNFAVVFFFSWLYLGGAKKFNILDKIKNRKSKGNKVARQQENIAGSEKKMNGNF